MVGIICPPWLRYVGLTDLPKSAPPGTTLLDRHSTGIIRRQLDVKQMSRSHQKDIRWTDVYILEYI